LSWLLSFDEDIQPVGNSKEAVAATYHDCRSCHPPPLHSSLVTSFATLFFSATFNTVSGRTMGPNIHVEVP
jgi:hypothetical protein